MDNNMKKSDIVKEKVCLDIVKGLFNEGDKFYTITDLKVKFGISKTTAHLILKDMVEDGYLMARKNTGFYVLPFVKNKLKKQMINENILLIKERILILNELGVGNEDIIKRIENI